ncbi:MAG: hypothetical protein CFE45_36885 [Burkholderiales bacterium PBB5]|nr:MAG: hypothetical protein CFE45_36885 [Burkholderiales bacterium PBB5]
MRGQPDEATLLARVAQLDDAGRAQAPIFLPYLNGERTPHNNPQAQGVFFGLHSGHGAADLGWAVIEGVAFGLADGWRALGAAPGSVPALSLVGGGARSPLWAQLLADVLDMPLHTHPGGEAGGALGAARLGWLAHLGEQGVDEVQAEALVCTAPPVARRFEPRPAEQPALAARQQRFAALYRALQPLMGVLPVPAAAARADHLG